MRLRAVARVAAMAAVALAAAAADDHTAKMEQWISAQAKARGFMGSVLVARGGRVVLERGYGSASLELNVPNTPANKFRIGSITKQFTAAAILQLEERGKLSTRDPVCKYIDGCPAAWKPVTIRHLLSHTSGIPSYTNFPEFATPRFMRQPLSPLAIVMLSRDKPLEFRPGEKWKYDNTAYVLLGYVIEKVSGLGYATYIRERILDPLGMKDTGYDDTRTVLPGRAAGYEYRQGRYRNADYIDMSLPFSAGSLYSTVKDLYQWDRALYTDRVVSRKSYQAMTTPVLNGYGYGLDVKPMFGHRQVGHGGGINGFSTCINRFPDDDAAVIVFSNVVNANACGIAKGLAGILFGEKVELPR